jgi:ribonuclease HII
MLSEDRREAVFDEVARWCADAAVGHASPAECDRWGMTLAWRIAACRALAVLELTPSALVVDGPWDLLRPREVQGALFDQEGDVAQAPIPDVAIPEVVLPIVHGDALCAAVSAASVLAKVVRDRHMREEAEHFPAYSFDVNKGYPSPQHKIALRGYGLSSIHRRSWAFVDSLGWATGTGRPVGG